MDEKRLKKVLIEIKNGLGLDYALHKGFVSPTCTTKKLDVLYGDNSIGIYVRWFGKDQEQPQIRYMDKLYINHDFGSENSDFRKTKIVNILSKYYDVDWNYSDKKSILIKEKGESKDA